MPARQLLVFVILIFLAAGAVVVAVSSYKRSHLQATGDGANVNGETNKPGDKTTVDAPSTRIENDKKSPSSY